MELSYGETNQKVVLEEGNCLGRGPRVLSGNLLLGLYGIWNNLTLIELIT